MLAELEGLDPGALRPRPWKETAAGKEVAFPGRAILDINRFRRIFPSLVRPWQEALARLSEKLNRRLVNFRAPVGKAVEM